MLVVHICLLSMVGFSLQGCSTEEEAKLKETGSCQGCDLSGVDLEEANLEGGQHLDHLAEVIWLRSLG